MRNNRIWFSVLALLFALLNSITLYELIREVLIYRFGLIENRFSLPLAGFSLIKKVILGLVILTIITLSLITVKKLSRLSFFSLIGITIPLILLYTDIQTMRGFNNFSVVNIQSAIVIVFLSVLSLVIKSQLRKVFFPITAREFAFIVFPMIVVQILISYSRS